MCYSSVAKILIFPTWSADSAGCYFFLFFRGPKLLMKSIINKKDKYSDIKKFNPANIFLTLFELIQLKFVKMFDSI